MSSVLHVYRDRLLLRVLFATASSSDFYSTKKCSALTLKALHRLQLSSGSECCRASKCKMSTQFIIFSRLSSTEKCFANLYGPIITNNLLKPLLYIWVRESFEMEDHTYRNLYSDDDLQSLVLIAGSHFPWWVQYSGLVQSVVLWLGRHSIFWKIATPFLKKFLSWVSLSLIHIIWNHPEPSLNLIPWISSSAELRQLLSSVIAGGVTFMQGCQHLVRDKMQQGSKMRCSYWLMIALLTIHNMVWPNEIYSVKMGYCPALKVNVFEVLVDLLYKILQVCARNANPYWPSGQKKI